MQYVKLPNPLLPNSLADVTHAARCISSAGLKVEGCSDWICDNWVGHPVDSRIDKACMECMQTAGGVVQPFGKYNPDCFKHSLPYQPLTTTAILRWASPALCQVYAQEGAISALWFWQALQCCTSLRKISSYYPSEISSCVHDMTLQAQLAAEHLVAVTRRPIQLKVECCACKNPWTSITAANHMKQELRAKLPSSVRLQECIWHRKYLKTEFSLGGNGRLVVMLDPAGQQQHEQHYLNHRSVMGANQNVSVACTATRD